MVLPRVSLNKEEETILIECNAGIKLNPKTNTVKPLYTNTEKYWYIYVVALYNMCDHVTDVITRIVTKRTFDIKANVVCRWNLTCITVLHDVKKITMIQITTNI